MATAVKMLLPARALTLHNQMIVAILQNAQYGSRPPQRLRGSQGEGADAKRPADRGTAEPFVIFRRDGVVEHSDIEIPAYDPRQHIFMQQNRTPRDYFKMFSGRVDLDKAILGGPAGLRGPGLSYKFCVQPELASFDALQKRLQATAQQCGLTAVSDAAVRFVKNALEAHIQALISDCMADRSLRRDACGHIRRAAFLSTPPAALHRSFAPAVRKQVFVPRKPAVPLATKNTTPPVVAAAAPPAAPTAAPTAAPAAAPVNPASRKRKRPASSGSTSQRRATRSSKRSRGSKVSQAKAQAVPQPKQKSSAKNESANLLDYFPEYSGDVPSKARASAKNAPDPARLDAIYREVLRQGLEEVVPPLVRAELHKRALDESYEAIDLGLPGAGSVGIGTLCNVLEGCDGVLGPALPVIMELVQAARVLD